MLEKRKYYVGDVLTTQTFGVPVGNIYVCGPNPRGFVKYLQSSGFTKLRVGYVICDLNRGVRLYPVISSGRRRFVPVAAQATIKTSADGGVYKRVAAGAFTHHFSSVFEAWEGRKFYCVARDNMGQFILREGKDCHPPRNGQHGCRWRCRIFFGEHKIHMKLVNTSKAG